MKSDLSPQLAARLGSGLNGDGQRRGPGPRLSEDRGMGGAMGALVLGARGGSDYSKLRGIIRSQKDQVTALENEVAHFQTRLHRIEDGHRLELARLKKEVDYHKRLRQGADQRSYELEDRLSRLQQQQQAARHGDHDEEKDSLIVQSQLLVSKNSELTYKLKTLESQVSQLEELKAALEGELNQAYGERDELAEELEIILSRQHNQNHARAEAEGDGLDGYDDGGEVGGTAADGDGGGPSNDGEL